MKVDYEYIGSLVIKDELALSINIIGNVTDKILELMQNPEIKEQLDKIDPVKLKKELVDLDIAIENYSYKKHKENLIMIVFYTVLRIQDTIEEIKRK